MSFSCCRPTFFLATAKKVFFGSAMAAPSAKEKENKKERKKEREREREREREQKERRGDE